MRLFWRNTMGASREVRVGQNSPYAVFRRHQDAYFHGCFISMVQEPPVGQIYLIIEASRSHSLKHTTLGRNSQKKWSTRHRDFLTTHDSHKRQTSISPAGILPASERTQTTPARPLWSFFFSHRRVAKSNVNDVLRQILFVTAWCACLKVPFRPAYIHTAPSLGVPIITAVLNYIKHILVRIWVWICYKHLNLIGFCREGAFRRVGTYPFA